MSWSLYFSGEHRYISQNVNMISDSASTVNKWKQGNMPRWGEWAAWNRWTGMDFSVFEQRTKWWKQNSPCSYRVKDVFLIRVPITKGPVNIFLSPLTPHWNPLIIFKLLGEYKKGQVESAKLIARVYNWLCYFKISWNYILFEGPSFF